MRLENLTADIRPMSTYHAIELGFAVARAWYGELWQSQLPTLLVVAPVFFGFAYAFPKDYFWALLVIVSVFLKSDMEPSLLAFLSQKLFSRQVDGQLHKDFWGNLRWRTSLKYRFGVRRPMTMAVGLLEGQTGSNAKKRLSLLSRRTHGVLFLLTLMFFVAEMVLFWGGLSLLLMLFEGPYRDIEVAEWIVKIDAYPSWFRFVACLWYTAVMSVLSPFFVSAGFCVYLCRRSLLEGWDIELVFRQMAQRHKALVSRDEPLGGSS